MDAATAFLIVIAVVAAALGVVLIERRRRAILAERIDRMAARLLGAGQGPPTSPEEAVERLGAALETWRASVIHAGPERRYLAVLEAVPLGVVVVDEADELLFVNDAAAWYRAGRHGEAVVAHTIDELIAQAHHGATLVETVQLYGPPRRRLNVTASPIEGDRQRLGVLVLIDDVTEQEKIDSIRRDFVSNISHELRTPIGAISLLAETLVGEQDPVVVESLAARLSAESERLAATIDDLLELSRIEHGGDVDFEPLVLQSVVAGAHDRVRAAAQQRAVEIGVSLPEKDLAVLGDRRQLTSAVFNLLDNAVKYCRSDGGTIALRARQVDDDIELTVQDNGIGIPRKDLDRIFERFYRVDRGRSRMSGGTGLGLSMVRHIVANHGGEVAVDSVEGEGTTFTIELPAYPPPPGDALPDDRSDGDRDDHEVTSQ